jgi:hypothetical protein
MVVAFAASALLIFARKPVLHAVGVDSIAASHPQAVGIVFLASGLFTCTYIFDWTARIIRRALARRQSRKCITALTYAEKKVLQPFLVNQTKSRPLSLADGVVRGLESKGIIYRSTDAGRLGPLGPTFAFSMEDWVWSKLMERPELIETEDGWPMSDRENRYGWME